LKHKDDHKQLESFREICHTHGLRVTPQRLAVYRELLASSDHPTAEVVFSKVRQDFPTVSFNTVNETLLTFFRVGLVQVVEGFGHSRRYDPNLTSHHHVHCRECGKIMDFVHTPFDSIEPPLRLRKDFEITGARVILTGICNNCQKKHNTNTKR